MDMNNENWELGVPLPDMEAELKKIRKDIRNRNRKIVLTSIVLVMALLIGIVQIGIPAIEKQYWNPNTYTYAPKYSDLEFTMAAYSELFVPAYTVSRVRAAKTGFATYELSLSCIDNRNGNEISQFSSSLIQNELSVPPGLWEYAPSGSFDRDDSIHRTRESGSNNSKKVLLQLPEYIMVRADVSFPEDLSMEEIVDFQNILFSYNNSIESTINWIAIRSCPEDTSLYPLCGMKPFTMFKSIASSLYGEINNSYPSLFNKSYSPQIVEEHFKSLLQYSADQVRNGTGIIPDYTDLGGDYYQTVLNYVEEHGIYAYGCTITATPKQLLELLENGTISRIMIRDVWIGFYN